MAALDVRASAAQERLRAGKKRRRNKMCGAQRSLGVGGRNGTTHWRGNNILLSPPKVYEGSGS